MEFVTVSREDLEQIAEALDRFNGMPDELGDIDEINDVVRALGEAGELMALILGDHRS